MMLEYDCTQLCKYTLRTLHCFFCLQSSVPPSTACPNLRPSRRPPPCITTRRGRTTPQPDPPACPSPRSYRAPLGFRQPPQRYGRELHTVLLRGAAHASHSCVRPHLLRELPERRGCNLSEGKAADGLPDLQRTGESAGRSVAAAEELRAGRHLTQLGVFLAERHGWEYSEAQYECVQWSIIVI